MGLYRPNRPFHGGINTSNAKKRSSAPKAHGSGRSPILICTDAAGEGINLQFCWIMINYDVPWNPARLEQRMGRIHRYGQKHDPVVIMNLVAPSTREGKVLKVLLDKLEKIRKELQSDKVFDCIGRLFDGVSIKRYMELAVTEDADEVALQLDGRLTKDQIEAVSEREKSLYGTGGDVAKELSRLRVSMEHEVFFRLMPGYIRQYIQQAAPLLDIEIDGDMDGVFKLRLSRFGAMDRCFGAGTVPEKYRDNFSVVRRPIKGHGLAPSRRTRIRTFRALTTERDADVGMPVRSSSSVRHKPYLSIWHASQSSEKRSFGTAESRRTREECRCSVGPSGKFLSREEVLECRLVGICQHAGSEIASALSSISCC